jgi:hypothetical protein
MYSRVMSDRETPSSSVDRDKGTPCSRLEASFFGDPVDSSHPIRLVVTRPFAGRVKGMRLGDPPDGIRIKTKKLVDGKLDLDEVWRAAWHHEGGHLVYLDLTDRRYVERLR